jgi:outer membrane lipoprotein-sorting protein
MDVERQFERIVKSIGDPDAPREEHRRRLRRQVLEAVESAGPSAPMILPPKKRMTIMNHSIIRWTTAAAVFLICAALIFTHTGHLPTAAWADVGENLERAQTLSLKVTVYQGKELREEQRLEVYTDRVRSESKGSVAIMDLTSEKMLVLLPTEKQALMFSLKDALKSGYRNWLADLKRIVGNKNAKEIGAETFEKRPCRGWQVTNSEGVVTVWADEKTAELVRVEIKTGVVRTVMSDFNFHPQLDASQFSLEAPEGYEMAADTSIAGKDASEKDLLLLLRAWAGGNDGVFPDSLLDFADWFKAYPKYDWSKEKQDEKTMRMAISRAFFKLKAEQQYWVYRGKGVKRGDAKKAIFWSPAGKDKYRVIYGDLSVRLVSKKDLPQSHSSP